MGEVQYCLVVVHLHRNFFLSSNERSSWKTLQNMRTSGWSAENPFLYSVFWSSNQRYVQHSDWQHISSVTANTDGAIHN